MNIESNKKSLKVLFIFNGTFVFASTLLGPLYAIFTIERFGENIGIATISWAVFLISSSVFTLIIGRFGDRIKETEYLLAFGYFLRGLIWILFPYIGSVGFLIFAQFIIGMGEAFGSPSYDALFAVHLNKKEKLREYSTWKIISNIANAIAVIIGGLVVQQFGFDILFQTMGILAIMSCVGILIQPRKLL
jgi:MFS family permease